ncbi:fluoride efflux transporter CrcB [Sporolactobacillus sp. THM7-7]|nr:fluoride efflux transporter CrcB [Sporolactobacillus sp. THM7-7]
MLTNFLAVAVGAAFGVLCRVLATDWIKKRWTHSFPLATFVVNISGSLLLGFAAALASVGLSLLLGTGFLGALTTFSTFNVENIELQRRGKYRVLIGYAGGSYIFGIIAVFIGLVLGDMLKSGLS